MKSILKCCCGQNKPIKKKYNSTPINEQQLLNIFEILDQRYLVRDYKSDPNPPEPMRPYRRKTKTGELIRFFESINKTV